jgi:hypothetical protein
VACCLARRSREARSVAPRTSKPKTNPKAYGFDVLKQWTRQLQVYGLRFTRDEPVRFVIAEARHVWRLDKKMLLQLSHPPTSCAFKLKNVKGETTTEH